VPGSPPSRHATATYLPPERGLTRRQCTHHPRWGSISSPGSTRRRCAHALARCLQVRRCYSDPTGTRFQQGNHAAKATRFSDHGSPENALPVGGGKKKTGEANGNDSRQLNRALASIVWIARASVPAVGSCGCPEAARAPCAAARTQAASQRFTDCHPHVVHKVASVPQQLARGSAWGMGLEQTASQTVSNSAQACSERT
jgi:hypothetical protein